MPTLRHPCLSSSRCQRPSTAARRQAQAPSVRAAPRGRWLLPGSSGSADRVWVTDLPRVSGPSPQARLPKASSSQKGCSSEISKLGVRRESIGEGCVQSLGGSWMESPCSASLRAALSSPPRFTAEQRAVRKAESATPAWTRTPAGAWFRGRVVAGGTRGSLRAITLPAHPPQPGGRGDRPLRGIGEARKARPPLRRVGSDPPLASRSIPGPAPRPS